MKRSYELIVAIAVCVAFASGFVLAKEVYKVPPRHCNYAGAVVKCKSSSSMNWQTDHLTRV